MHLNLWSAQWRPFWLGRNMLTVIPKGCERTRVRWSQWASTKHWGDLQYTVTNHEGANIPKCSLAGSGQYTDVCNMERYDANRILGVLLCDKLCENMENYKRFKLQSTDDCWSLVIIHGWCTNTFHTYIELTAANSVKCWYHHPG